MLLEIGLFKQKTKQKKKKQNKKKEKEKKRKKKREDIKIVWAIPVPISTTKDAVCCSNGYIYIFF